MNLILDFTSQTGIRLAEVGFLLIVFAGVWLIGAQIPQFKFGKARTIVAGAALAIGGRFSFSPRIWGHFG